MKGVSYEGSFLRAAVARKAHTAGALLSCKDFNKQDFKSILLYPYFVSLRETIKNLGLYS